MTKKTFPETIILGSSNYTGFRIYDDIAGIKVKTKNYNSFSLKEKIAKILTMFVIASFVFFVFKIGDTIIHKLLACFLCLVFINHMALPIISPRIYSMVLKKRHHRDGMEWHAAEHKLIALLRTEEDLSEITMANLKKASLFSPFCGGGNSYLKEPSKEKLLEALKVGRIFYRKMEKVDRTIYYIRLAIHRKNIEDKRSKSSFFFY